MKKAIFASGCFWGTEYYLKKIPGVIQTRVGYTGGKVEDPDYEQVSRGGTGHLEAVELIYDPRKVTYEKLVKVFFETHDPTQEGGQGPDIGPQYQSVIFYQNESEKAIASRLIEMLAARGLKVVTRLEPASKFWEAEEHHQQYYQKSGGKPYCHAYNKLF